MSQDNILGFSYMHYWMLIPHRILCVILHTDAKKHTPFLGKNMGTL